MVLDFVRVSVIMVVYNVYFAPVRNFTIAAPASYWYLRALPINRIAEIVGYIIYMTYDLHEQWTRAGAE
jgi:spore germination protein YaaH